MGLCNPCIRTSKSLNPWYIHSEDFFFTVTLGVTLVALWNLLGKKQMASIADSKHVVDWRPIFEKQTNSHLSSVYAIFHVDIGREKTFFDFFERFILCRRMPGVCESKGHPGGNRGILGTAPPMRLVSHVITWQNSCFLWFSPSIAGNKKERKKVGHLKKVQFGNMQ